MKPKAGSDSTQSALAVLRSPDEVRAWRLQAPSARVGFVPTMGALHAGHAALLAQAKKDCDLLVLSVFVNPTQFGPGEDFSKYPRTFEQDLEVARTHGVDAVFAPGASDLYPEGFSTFVEETRLSQPLCGEFRPGHFRGVATVVLKLLNIVRPDFALFGMKDAQQYFVIRRMARDLDLPVEIRAFPTVREEDGLALSSRNRYLSVEERARAPFLYQMLCEARDRMGTEPAARVLSEIRERIQASGFRLQYLEALKLPDFAPVERADSGTPVLIAVAAFLGKTRLIDNVVLNPESAD